MKYDRQTYQADRLLVGFTDPGVGFSAGSLKLKRMRFELEPDGRDQAAFEAAHARLLAWVEAGEPELDDDTAAPEPAATAEAAPAGQAAGTSEPPSRVEHSFWKKLLAAQQARHKRRRAAYPHVRPTPGKRG